MVTVARKNSIFPGDKEVREKGEERRVKTVLSAHTMSVCVLVCCAVVVVG